MQEWNGTMRSLVIAGARPNFMKVAPILRALEARGHPGVLVHTGQHYDFQLSETFFQELGLPEPAHHLEVGSASHAVQTARCMEAFEPVLMTERPHWVVVVGDVNSTLACSLVTAKLRETLGCRLAHVEAGLRSRDWRMPEEVNRVLTDRLSDCLLTPSPEAELNLRDEGIDVSRVVFVGNVMIDTLMDQLPHARALDVPGRLGLDKGRYAVVTLHRPSNVDDPAALETILRALGRLSADLPVVFPVHPRTRKQVETFGLEALLKPLKALPPVAYREMMGAVADSGIVLTDSGGLQEETTVLGIPCVTLREQTERPVTVDEGTNRLVPWPITEQGLLDTAKAALEQGPRPGTVPRGWDGKAAERVVEALLRRQEGGLAAERHGP